MLVRCDSSSAIGSGHAMRCLALAKAWQRVGSRVCYLTAESIATVDERLAAENIEQQRMIAHPGTSEDAEQTVAWARRMEAKWVVIDGYRFKQDYIHQLKASGLRVLALDDDARFDFYEADVVFNQNIDAKAETYQVAAGTQLLLGAKYVLIRPEFLAERTQAKIAGVVRKLLVTMGGSDPGDVTSKVVRALSRLGADFLGEDLEIVVVVGGGNPRYESLQALVRGLPLKVRLEKNIENMAPVMSWADLAISAAGGTCWELAFLGIPMIVITISRDQERNAAAIAKAGAAVSLGWHEDLSEENIGDAVRTWANDAEARSAMSERARKLIDGQGATRVVEFLQSNV
jgi:UDP-2,4-diacetamido-2,4,6-trideoxy-beta-L-altropyranose hydrolase